MKIFLADPNSEVRSALHLIINRIPEVTEVSEAGNLVQLMTQCGQSCPDLILFDLGIVQPSRGQTRPLTDFISSLRHLCPCSRIVVMSSRFSAEEEAKVARASGFISKTDPADEVFSAIIRYLDIRS